MFSNKKQDIKKEQSLKNIYYETIRDNLKLEIALIILLGISVCAYVCFANKMPTVVLDILNILSKYLSAERISNATEFYSLTIAIYLTIITLLSTSIISISGEMLRRNLDKKLIAINALGMLESLIAILSSIFINNNNNIYYILICHLYIMSTVTFFKFAKIMIIFFHLNMDLMAKEIDTRDRYDKDLLATIEQIELNTKK